MSRPQDSPALGGFQVLAAAALFSTGGAAVKAISLGGLEIAGLRSALAAVFLYLVLPRARQRWDRHVWLGGMAYAATLVLYVNANKLTTAANAIFLQSTAPIYVLLLGPWLLRESLRRRDVAFLGFIALGLGLFFVSPDPATAVAADPLRGNALGALSGLTWALCIMALRFHSQEARGARGSGAAVVVCGNLLAALVCLPWMLTVREASPADLVGVGYLGAVQVGLAYVVLLAGIRHVRAFEASLLLLAEPVLSPFWAWLVHAERPTAWALAGGAVILSATVVHSLPSRNR